MKIKIRLKEILAEREMSQRELSRLTNIRPATINALCKDTVDKGVYLRTLEQICTSLNIDVNELIVSDYSDDNELN